MVGSQGLEPWTINCERFGSNQTTLLRALIRHHSRWKCTPPTWSEGGSNLVRGVLGNEDDEIGAALSLRERGPELITLVQPYQTAAPTSGGWGRG
jgi:hypothetical protein